PRPGVASSSSARPGRPRARCSRRSPRASATAGTADMDEERSSVGLATPPAAPPAQPARRSDRRRIVGIVAAALVLAFLAYALANGWGRVSDYDWRLEWHWPAGGGPPALPRHP